MKKIISAGLFGIAALAAQASPVAVDGSLGAEWSGVTATVVGYNPSAPTSNFGAPGANNHNVGYSVYYRADANYMYGLMVADGNTNGMNWGNLYFNTNLSGGSDIVVELDNNRAFALYSGMPTDMHLLTSYLTVAHSASNLNHVLEWAIAWDYFSDTPAPIMPTGTDPAKGVQLRMIQGFGYSVAGGDMDPQTSARFGTVNNVPEPSSLALGGLALLGALAAGRRRAAKA